MERIDIGAVHTFPGNVPLRRNFRIVHADLVLVIKRRIQKFKHELLDVAFINPRCTEPDINFVCFKFLRLSGGQSFHIDSKSRIVSSVCFSNP